jgi:hypothetical protein
MLKRIIWVAIMAFGVALCLGGCGSETSGSIALTAPTYANGIATASATYTPASGAALSHQKITFYWRTVGKTTNSVVDYPPHDSYTDSSGKASSDLSLPSPRTEAYVVYVKASTGDLTTSVQSVDTPL